MFHTKPLQRLEAAHQLMRPQQVRMLAGAAGSAPEGAAAAGTKVGGGASSSTLHPGPSLPSCPPSKWITALWKTRSAGRCAMDSSVIPAACSAEYRAACAAAPRHIAAVFPGPLWMLSLRAVPQQASCLDETMCRSRGLVHDTRTCMVSEQGWNLLCFLARNVELAAYRHISDSKQMRLTQLSARPWKLGAQRLEDAAKSRTLPLGETGPRAGVECSSCDYSQVTYIVDSTCQFRCYVVVIAMAGDYSRLQATGRTTCHLAIGRHR